MMTTSLANVAVIGSGALSVAGATALTAGGNDITLLAANHFGGALTVHSARHLRLNDVAALMLGDVTLSGVLDLTTSGDLTQAAGSALNIRGTTTLAVGTLHDLTLAGRDNDFGDALRITSARHATLTYRNSLTFGTSTRGSMRASNGAGGRFASTCAPIAV